MLSPTRRSEKSDALDETGCLRRVVTEPAPSEWAETLRERFETRDEPRATRFRAELGLPTDRPLIATGHQAGFWHPGVLAKFIAARLAGERFGAGAWWIVPDQDDEPVALINAPTLDERGALRRETADLGGGDEAALLGVAAASRPPFDPVPPRLAGEPALPTVAEGLDAVVEALRAHADAESAAAQAESAGRRLAAPFVGEPQAAFATALTRTTLFRDLIDRIRSDPAGALDVYNEAAREHPASGVLPLASGRNEGARETPLWRLAPNEPRRRVTVADLADAEPVTLAPRGLLMTALVRLAGADLFIHGTGGAQYDRVTERWIRDWLGEELAPVGVVTADLLLPLPGAEFDEAHMEQAVWRAHHARHDPAMLGDDQGAREKAALVRRIADARARAEDPSGMFLEMHALLERVRRSHADALDRLDREAEQMRRLRASAEVAQDRTWAFPLHEHRSLRALERAIAERFEV